MFFSIAKPVLCMRLVVKPGRREHQARTKRFFNVKKKLVLLCAKCTQLCAHNCVVTMGGFQHPSSREGLHNAEKNKPKPDNLVSSYAKEYTLEDARCMANVLSKKYWASRSLVQCLADESPTFILRKRFVILSACVPDLAISP